MYLTPKKLAFSVRVMKNVQIWRPNFSSYLSPQYAEIEKKQFELLPGVNYTKEPVPHLPLIILSNTHTKLSQIETYLPQTELMIHANSGYDNLWPLSDYFSFPVVLGQSIRAHAVAEWILSCLFHHFCPIQHNTDWIKGRSFNRERLKDKHLFLVGYGTIGKILKPVLEPLVKKLTINDPPQGFNHHPHDFDILIVCASFNPQNFQMINAKFLSHLNPSGLLINTARGELLHEEELISHLTHHPKLKCYLDVFYPEPTDPKKWNEKQVIITPHQAGVYAGLEQEMIHFSLKILQDFLTLSDSLFLNKYKNELLLSKKNGEQWI